MGYAIACTQCPYGTRQQATLTLKRDELLYDINNYAYIEGHTMAEDTLQAEHGRHMTTDVGQEGNLDRALRVLALAHAMAVEMLYPYTKKQAAEAVEIDDKMWEPEDYVIEMSVPQRMSLTTLHLLCRLIHEWMVYKALADWLSITNPDASLRWERKAQDAQEQINAIKNTRTGTLTRPLQPF